MSKELLNILNPEEGTIPLEEEYLVFKEIFKKEEYVKQIKEAIEEGKKSIEVDYEDIKKVNYDIAEVLLSKNGLNKLNNYVLGSLPPKSGIKTIRYINIPHVDLKDVKNNKKEGRIISTEGIVKMAGDVKPLPGVYTYICSCTEGTEVKVDYRKGKDPIGDLCKCGLVFNTSNYIEKDREVEDTQWLKIQEKPDGGEGTAHPTDIKILLKNDLVNKVVAGDVIRITGVLKANINHRNKNKNFYFLEGNNIEVEEKGYGDIKYTEEEVEEFIKLSEAPDLENKIYNTIAPKIVEFEEEKKAIALQLFGGVPEDEGKWERGDIHVLVMGDPGVGKTSTFEYVSRNIAPKCIHASGKSSTGVGLTATVKKAGEFGDDGEWVFEAGAMVLADNGLCVVDELDKMNDYDRDHIGDAIEQQQIYLNKAGVHATLRSRCSLLAGGNPEGGRVDREKEDLIAQLKLSPHLISRFDFIYIRPDIHSVEKDSKVADSILYEETREARAKEGIPPELLKKYIAYARSKVKPKINKEANDILREWYVKLRNPEKGNGEGEILNLDARILQSLKRGTQARARMYLREEATVEDAYKTIEIMEESLESSGRDPITGKIDLALRDGSTPSRQKDIDRIVEEVISEFNEEYYNPDNFYKWYSDKGIREDASFKLLEKVSRQGMKGFTFKKAEEELKKGVTLKLTKGIP